LIRIAVVGCGYWGPNYVRVLSELQNCEVTVCCDLDESKLLAIKTNRASIRTTTDIETILKDETIDAVCISTPASTHYSLALKCLGNGKNVLIEKPLTLGSSEAKDLVKMAERMNKILMVGHVYQYHPVMIELKKRILQGDFGKIYYVYSTRTGLGPIRSDTNAMWDLAPHDISMILELVGSTPKSVSATGSSYLRPNIPDVVFLNMKFSSNVISQVHVSWLDPHKIRRLTVVGSKMMAVFDDVDVFGKLKIFKKNVARFKQSDGYEFLLNIADGDTIIPKIDSSEPLKNMGKCFLESIKNGEKPITDGVSALSSLAVLESCQESLDNQGKTVEVKI
jgi:predicted dehydrogenase|tara:strand:- start:287 stop:1297 length:1011 start_codon:yes stop_codon:yes gene_type:complete